MDMMAVISSLAAASVFCIFLAVKKIRAETNWMHIRYSTTKKQSKDIFAFLYRDAWAMGLEITRNQIMGILAAGVCISIALVYAVTGKPLISILGFPLGFAAPYIWVKRKISGRTEAFKAQLETALNQMASSLRAGQNIRQALEQAAISAEAPANEILGYAVQLLKSGGYNITEAMEETSKLVKSKEMETLALVTSICAQSGGNLASIYDQLADSIRDKRAFASQVGAATGESRMTANVLLVLPFLAIGVMRMLSPEYMEPLFSSGGLVILGICSAVIIAGYLIIKRLGVVEY
ncbi:flp pilus assembly protein TadB [Desulfocucumis palustris]|uniref:Flp pilus assembly protein TadB n=2 Tax=Desulfocucumis palustris TaxID=1898651 RepID=A0A2L2XCJ9_9FIRM|nr:flp pilus assembly protein TadB [Desulfocucumis palustris]